MWQAQARPPPVDDGIWTSGSAQVPSEDAERVEILTPETLFEFLEQLGVEAPTENTVRGYKVRVKYRHVPDALARTRTITQTIAGALKRMRSQ